MRISAGGAVVASYFALFSSLLAIFGAGAAAFSLVPVAVFSWLSGPRIGLAAGILAVPLNALLLNLNGMDGWDAVLTGGGAAGSVVVALAGLGVGLLARRWWPSSA